MVTWNVHDRLLNRPVTKGENLLEVADPTKDWELEVQMPEKRMGSIAKAAAHFEKHHCQSRFSWPRTRPTK